MLLHSSLLRCLMVLNAILTQMFKYWFCAIFLRVLSVSAIFYKLGNCPLLSTNTLNTSNRPSSRRIRLCQNYTHCTPKYPSLCYEIHPRWLFDVYFVRFAETTHVSDCYWLNLGMIGSTTFIFIRHGRKISSLPLKPRVQGECDTFAKFQAPWPQSITHGWYLTGPQSCCTHTSLFLQLCGVTEQ